MIPEGLKDFSVQEKVKLGPHTSWLIGGAAEFYATPATIDELRGLYTSALNEKIKVTILGGGTNVLVSDQGVEGLVIALDKLTGIEILDNTSDLCFWALAGTPKSELLKIFLKHKLAPARMMAGLPGQVSGGFVMNAGVSEKLTPKEFVEITEEVEVLRPDGRLEVLDAKTLRWSYRHCEGWKPGVITRVKLAWPMKPEPSIQEEVKALNQGRIKKQPLDKPSCGSVFANPYPEHAGSLIERAGLKGHKMGGAQISEKHANFIVNLGNASSDDVKGLIDLCVKTVQDKFNITLKTEVIFL